MSSKVPSIDAVLKRLNNRQKYLGVKFAILFLLILFIYIPTISTENLDELVFLNSTLLLSLPILFDYRYGLDTISTFTNLFRWIGFAISGILTVVCVISYMGGTELLYEDKLLSNIFLFGFKINIVVWKFLIWSLPIVAFLDWIFSFGPREAAYYKLQDELNKDIIEKISKAKSENTFDEKVALQKQELVKTVPKGE